MSTGIADYDSNDYDYRTYWNGREYESMAEDRALRRLIPALGRVRCLVDFGGGFGRNARHYRAAAAQYVIVDYSATNLTNASELLAHDIAAGRAFLIRADINALPFDDAAFDAAIVVRVLHHLPDLGRSLAEMGRVVGGRWLIDVPIKHHALGLVRGVARRDWRAVHGPDPLRTSAGAEPFWNFQLAAVRRLLGEHGWQTRVAASVNNLRRWDRRLPPRLVRAMGPTVRLVEALAQRLGIGWWGPNQFLVASRPATPSRRSTAIRIWPAAPAIAALVACITCHSGLSWTADAAFCLVCRRRYERVGSYWDFVVADAAGRSGKPASDHEDRPSGGQPLRGALARADKRRVRPTDAQLEAVCGAAPSVARS
jgi:SAM-dependent methyltransferase